MSGAKQGGKDMMEKFAIARAWRDTVQLTRQRGLAVLGVFVLVGVIAAVIGFAVLASLFGSFAQFAAGASSQTASALASNIGLFGLAYAVFGLLYIGAYMAAWRVALSPPGTGFGDGLIYGIKACVPVLLAGLLFSVAAAAVFLILMLPFGFATTGLFAGFNNGAGPPASMFLAAFGFVILFLVLFLFVYARLGIAGPLMAARRMINPFRGLAESWRLTRGHSLRLMGYIFLFNLAFFAAYLMIGTIVGLMGVISPTLVYIVMIPVYLLAFVVQITMPAGIYTTLRGHLVDEDLDEIFGEDRAEPDGV